MKKPLQEFLTFFFKNDRKTIVARIHARDVPPLVQFGLYSVCGSVAAAVYAVTIILLSKYVIPAYEHMQVNGEEITNKLRAHNFLINSCIAFAITNVLAYVSNILLVFKSGRHHPVLEFLYFTLVSGTSFALSLVAGPLLVRLFGVPTNIALCTNMIFSMLINFAARKFFVFKH